MILFSLARNVRGRNLCKLVQYQRGPRADKRGRTNIDGRSRPVDIETLVNDEPLRRTLFPAAATGPFLAHAAVAPLPKAAVDAIARYMALGSRGNQEGPESTAVVESCRDLAARLLNVTREEIALIGPTSLGLSLVARGLAWRKGDEVIFHADDYPANVYPWRALAAQGVTPVALRPEKPGVITWELVESALTPNTRLVSLASCHFLSGYRIDVEGIGRRLRERGVLFCLDAIQTLGAWPLDAREVDFLAADAHKWLLGPSGAGIFYVRRELQDQLTPALLGSWNVDSPGFIAQEELRFHPSARRYEPGSLNYAGLCGMAGALTQSLAFGIDNIAARLLHLRGVLIGLLRDKGYQTVLADEDVPQGAESAIVPVHKDGADLPAIAAMLAAHGMTLSQRRLRSGQELLRFSPHFYTTEDELARTVELLP
jgi:cysteine desulfurase/selenocysteine lyase